MYKHLSFPSSMLPADVPIPPAFYSKYIIQMDIIQMDLA